MKKRNTGRDATDAEIAEARRVQSLPEAQKAGHPSAVKADPAQLAHINTYGQLPAYYLDIPFTCRRCGKTEIWKAADQKWYYETAKGHIDARAVNCHACRVVPEAPRRERP
jgi:hypothetical protein